MNPIAFSPPDIGQDEIEAVSRVLRSGWITTGPEVKAFEKEISTFLGGGHSLCLNSATAGLELALRSCGIRPGDEVLTTPYTFAATSNVILHLGARPIFADLKPNSFNISAETLAPKLSSRTRAVLTVDYGGFPVDFPAIRSWLDTIPDQNRPFLISDSAHSFGAKIAEKYAANFADISVFSFHAVKNLTTAEGGCLYIPQKSPFFDPSLFNKLKYLSLHGMSKDAFDKEVLGNWAYDILAAGYKYNMTDIQAAMGRVQLKRYPKLLKKRQDLYKNYITLLENDNRIILPPFDQDGFQGSFHLFPIRIRHANEVVRNKIITKLREEGIATNVHYRPLPLFTLYQNLGYQMSDYPNAFQMYQNEITLPLHTLLDTKQQTYIQEKLIKILDKEIS